MHPETSPIATVQLMPNGDAAHTATLTLNLRDAGMAPGLMGMLPPQLAEHPLTMAEGTRLFLPIDGDLTSFHLSTLLQRFGMDDSAIGEVRPALAAAVAEAQAGAGLSEFHHAVQALARA